MTILCSKSRFYFVHLPGGNTMKMVLPAICPCVNHYMCKSIHNLGQTLHTLGAQVIQSVHPAAKICTQLQGAWCTLNFEHCHSMLIIICCMLPHVHILLKGNERNNIKIICKRTL